jgi:hypothetical protein
MKLFRFLVPMGALLALLAFLPACDSDGGTTPATDTQGGDTVTPQCPAECGPCEECNEGTGFQCQTTCVTGEVCQEGACVPDTTTCEPACDAAMCMVCDEPTDTCKSACTAGQVCNNGTCVDEVGGCDPACGPCQVCNDADECVAKTCPAGQACNETSGQCEAIPCEPACGPCQECVAGACQDLCDASACQTCVAGACQGCADGFYCDAGTCTEIGVIECVAPNADGFCDASIVDELAIAPAPNATTGEPGCCCDFTGDGILDNQLGALVTNLGGMAGFDLVTLNETIAESLAGGSFIILFEHVGLAAQAADTPYFNVNFYLGADTDDDPANNFSGTAEFTIMPESLDANGDPLITFEGASVAGGMLHAGPSQFVVPIQIPDPPLDLTLTVDSAIVDAAVVWNNGYHLNDGKLCGYVTIAQIFGALNQFAATSCGCLNLSGNLIEGIATGNFVCGDSDPQCDANDPVDGDMQEICGTIAQYCGTAVVLLPSFLDVDTDDDGTGDAISLGATFGATSAVLTSGGM